jgi:hypothetical protein
LWLAGLQLRTVGSGGLLFGAPRWNLKDAVLVTSPAQDQYHWMNLTGDVIEQKPKLFLNPVVFAHAAIQGTDQRRTTR